MTNIRNLAESVKWRALPGYRQRRTREMEALAEEHVSDMQIQLGRRLNEALSAAASRNTVYNILPSGKRTEIPIGPLGREWYEIGQKLGSPSATYWTNNGGQYTVLVGIPDPLGPHTILQADINMRRRDNELHVYDVRTEVADGYFPLQNFGWFKQELARRVEHFQLFSRSA